MSYEKEIFGPLQYGERLMEREMEQLERRRSEFRSARSKRNIFSEHVFPKENTSGPILNQTEGKLVWSDSSREIICTAQMTEAPGSHGWGDLDDEISSLIKRICATKYKISPEKTHGEIERLHALCEQRTDAGSISAGRYEALSNLAVWCKKACAELKQMIVTPAKYSEMGDFEESMAGMAPIPGGAAGPVRKNFPQEDTLDDFTEALLGEGIIKGRMQKSQRNKVEKSLNFETDINENLGITEARITEAKAVLTKKAKDVVESFRKAKAREENSGWERIKGKIRDWLKESEIPKDLWKIAYFVRVGASDIQKAIKDDDKHISWEDLVTAPEMNPKAYATKATENLQAFANDLPKILKAASDLLDLVKEYDNEEGKAKKTNAFFFLREAMRSLAAWNRFAQKMMDYYD